VFLDSGEERQEMRGHRLVGVVEYSRRQAQPCYYDYYYYEHNICHSKSIDESQLLTGHGSQ